MLRHLTPYIEYHFAVVVGNTTTEHVESYKVGTTFAQVFEDWGFADRLVPYRLQWTKWAWPGSYPLYYMTEDRSFLCPDCANANLDLTLGDDPQWQIVAAMINYDDDSCVCDHCNNLIPSAYAGGDDV